MRKKGLLKKFLSGVLISALALSAVSVGAVSQKEEAKAADATDTATTTTGESDIVYHAALGIQTANTLWMQRLGYVGKFSAMGNDNVSGYGTAAYSKLTSDSFKKSYPGTFTDVEIKDNGTYTVSLDGADFSGETVCSQLHIATDIPLSSKITVSDLKVNVNDKEILTWDKGYLEDDDTYLECGKVFLAINHWRPDVEAVGKKAGLKTANNGFEIFTGKGNEKVSITFTVSGFDKKAEEQVQKDEQERKALQALIGKVKTSSGFSYKIAKATKTGGTVTLIKDSKNAAKRTIPAIVKFDGRTYKVTAIGSSAFSKNKKLQKVVIGKNVTKIGSKAFYNCAKLKTIDVKQNVSIKKVGKNITKNKKCKVLASKKKVKAYKKLFKDLQVK